MTLLNDQWDRELESIFDAACQKRNRSERSAYLDGACGQNVELREKVEVLLEAHDQAGDFLLEKTVERPREAPGEQIGRYKILQEIGEGGFGTVYMAEQQEPVRRKVAIKIIKLGMDTKQVIARFEAERQALALMNHPNIAKVFDAGSTQSGRPYFVMELVRGVPITKYCDSKKLNTEARLKIFLDICSAIQHAHQKGIIHRDIKPNNVLITLHDGRPVPKIIDFGIAKATHQRLTEKTLFTEYQQLIGTPQYMSPEQAEMSGLDIDTRSDIYSLGALLYELLTGSPPFEREQLRQAGYAEIQRIIREQSPPKPSTRVATLVQGDTEIAEHHGSPAKSFAKGLRGELDWIVMKAMAKDRNRRYETVSGLADDILRFLSYQPVLAGPPSISYHVKKFVRRHRVGVATTLLSGTALMIGFGLAVYGLVQARNQRDIARASQIRANVESARNQKIADYLQDLFVSSDPNPAIGLSVDPSELVQTSREVFGDDHATVAATLRSHALQLESAGRYEDAEKLLRESIRIWREQFGSENLNVATTLSHLGNLLRIKGDEIAAEQAFRESLRISRAAQGERRLVVADTLLKLSDALLNQGAYRDAERTLRESIRIRREIAPHQHLEIAISLSSLANSMTLGGKTKELESVLLECLDAFKKIDNGHNVVGKLQVQVGAYYMSQDRLAEAESYLRKGIETYGDVEAPPVMYVDAAVRYLAIVVDRMDDGSKEFVVRRVDLIDFLQQNFGDRYPKLGLILAEYSRYMIDQQEPVRAIEMAAEALQKLQSVYGHDSYAKTAFDSLIEASWILVRVPGRSQDDFQTALDAVDDGLLRNPGDPQLIQVRGAILYRLKKYDQAAKVLSETNRNITNDPDQTAVAAMIFEVMCLVKLEKVDVARNQMQRIETLRKNQEPASEVNRELISEAKRLLESAEPKDIVGQD